MELFLRIVYAFAVLILIYIAPWWIVACFLVISTVLIRWYFELFVFVTLYTVLQLPVHSLYFLGVLFVTTIGIVGIEYIRNRYFA